MLGVLFFLPAQAMQNNFHEFEELDVFFDLWIPDPGFRIPVPNSGFRFPGFRVAQTLNRFLKSEKSECILTLNFLLLDNLYF